MTSQQFSVIKTQKSISNIPGASNGWKLTPLINLLISLETGKRPRGGARGIAEGIPSVSAEHMTENGRFDFSDLRFVPKDFYVQMKRGHIAQGDILVVKDGATTGKVAFVDMQFPFHDAVVNEHVFLCKPNIEIVYPQFLFYWLLGYEGQKALRENYRGSAIGGINQEFANKLLVPLPSMSEQINIAKILADQMTLTERARTAAETQLIECGILIEAFLRNSLLGASTKETALNDVLVETVKGVGPSWKDYWLIGATRAGAAPAKDPVGKNPERYKLVEHGTVFYNPMRILLGSICMIEDDGKPAITSPDYVVFRGREGVVDSTWFYYWLRSSQGAEFIRSLTRGAVRERMLFKRLGAAHVILPAWSKQLECVSKIKQVMKLIKAIKEQLQSIELLPSALLRRAFSRKS